MKINKWLAFAAGALMLCSCADDFDTNTFSVARPGDAAQYDYLLDYAPLKEYIDSVANPNLKVGAYVDMEGYGEKKTLYAAANSNFKEFSLASAVNQQSNGSADGLDFGTASSFVSNALAAGIPVYGGSLLSVDTQNTSWFEGLVNGETSAGIREEKAEGPSGWPVKGPVDVTCIVRESGKSDVADEFKTIDGHKTSVITSNANPATAWDTQFFIGTPGKVWEAGEEYHITFWYKASAEADCDTQCHGNSAGAYKHWAMLPSNPHFTTEWQKYDMDGTIPDAGGDMQYIAFNLAKQNDPVTFYIADVEWIGNQLLTERTLDVVNSKMEEGKPMTSFIVREAGQGDKPGDILVGKGPEGMNCLAVHSISAPSTAWDTQFFITYSNGSNTGEDADFAFAGGQAVKVSMWIKADHAADTDSQCHKDPGGYMHWACLPNFPGFTTEWVKYEAEFEIPAEGDGMKSIAFNLNKDEVANTYYFADIHWQVTQKASAASKYFYDEETITNGNMTGTDMSSFVDNKTWAPMVVSEGEGPDGGNCIKFTSSTSDVNSWDSQVFIVANRLFAAGDTYTFEMDVKASEAISIGSQTQKGAGGYIHWAMLPANVEFTTEWTHVKFENAKIPSQATDGMNCIALCMGTGKEITYEIANVSWIRSEQLDKGTRALNQEEKSVAVTNAFTSWVTGAINGLGSSVTEWNFLDNLISDNGNVRNLSFNYNDYLKEDYIVMAEKLARETYAEVDTISPQALKLYLNQKNLQDAGVLAATKTLISDLAEKGVKIDGISTDITVNALSDLAAQKSSIVAMLKELNAMKLPVRISSVTVNGKTDTFSGLQDISEAYKMAVSSYVTNIDAANQRAIYVGGDIDKTLWFDSFTSRQPAYAGFADGLKGK